MPVLQRHLHVRRLTTAIATVGMVAGLCLSTPSLAQATASEKLPRVYPVEEFARGSQFSGARLSPDRTAFAFLTYVQGRRQVAVLDLTSGRITRVTDFRNRNASSVTWVSDTRLWISLDIEGNESFGLYAVNRDGSNFRPLVEPPIIQAIQGSRAPRFVRFERLIAGSKNEVLVSANDRSPRAIDLYRMDINTGRRSLVTVDRPPEPREWVVDQDDVPRVVRSWDKARREHVLLARTAADAPWREFHRYKEGNERIRPLFFAKDRKTLYVLSNIGRDTDAVFEYDLGERRLGRLLFEAPDGYDMGHEPFTLEPSFTNRTGGIIVAPDTEDIIGFLYNGERVIYEWKDEDYRRYQAEVDAALPGRVNAIAPAKAGDKLVVRSYSDRHALSLFLYEPGKRQLERVGSGFPWLAEADMAPQRPFEYRARDGLRIRGYVTLPVGREPRGLPAIVMPHGGPITIRDDWGYDPTVQFFANRGYAVIQMDFRGSGGYGRRLLQTGFKELGHGMIDDHTDAIRHFIKQGVVDPKRVCIYGYSYGGWATLVGLIREPSLYRCGVNGFGVTDYVDAVRAYSGGNDESFGPDVARDWFGDIDVSLDRRRMEEFAPVSRAADIRAPLLNGYGQNDPRVEVLQWRLLERALRGAGKSVDAVVYPNEGHGWRNEENRNDWYRRVEAFLRRNNPSDVLK